MHCINHIAQLGRLAPELQNQGFRVLAIGASDGESFEQTAAAFGARVDVLNDRDRIVYNRYGFGKIARLVQRSGTAVVDKSRVIRYLHRTANPKQSLKKDELLSALNAMT